MIYRIQINERHYAGDYSSATNAVFGAMRFRENELWRECGEGIPSFQYRSKSDKDLYYDRRNRAQKILRSNTVIMVEPDPQKRAKKVHRIA